MVSIAGKEGVVKRRRLSRADIIQRTGNTGQRHLHISGHLQNGGFLPTSTHLAGHPVYRSPHLRWRETRTDHRPTVLYRYFQPVTRQAVVTL
jgi:hypothetical protein